MKHGAGAGEGLATSAFRGRWGTREGTQLLSGRGLGGRSRIPLGVRRAMSWPVSRDSWCRLQLRQLGCRRALRGRPRISDVRAARCASLGCDRCYKRALLRGDARRPRGTIRSFDDRGSRTPVASRCRGTSRTTRCPRATRNRAACGNPCRSFSPRGRRSPTWRSSDDSSCRRLPSRRLLLCAAHGS